MYQKTNSKQSDNSKLNRFFFSSDQKTVNIIYKKFSNRICKFYVTISSIYSL